jgi:hypothetical protein
MCFYDDNGPVEFARTGVSIARKPHRCFECRQAIAPGEPYEWFTGKSSGDFFSLKACRRCCYDRVRVVEAELAEGCDWHESWPPWGWLVEHLSESGMGQTRTEDVPASFAVGDQPKVPEKATTSSLS